jgi:hypothetical protein
MNNPPAMGVYELETLQILEVNEAASGHLRPFPEGNSWTMKITGYGLRKTSTASCRAAKSK